MSRHQIQLRLRTGRLYELHRGVYLVGHAVAPPYAQETAALLACGNDAVLSHRSAACLWNLISYPAPGDVCVTLSPDRCATRPRIEIHRARLANRDIRRRHGIALTSPPRTILDLAGSLEPARSRAPGRPGQRETPARLSELEQLVAEAQYRHLASEAELRDQIGRNPGKRGIASLRTILALPGGARRTRSPAERDLLAMLRNAGVTGYEVNAMVHGYEVDLLWRSLCFAVELDGFEAHSGRVAFERDRLKMATLNAHGLTVMPVTPRQLREEPAAVLHRLLAALEQAGYQRVED